VDLWRGLSEGYRRGKVLFAAQIVRLHDLAMNSLQVYGSIGCSSKFSNGSPLISGIRQKFGNPPEQQLRFPRTRTSRAPFSVWQCRAGPDLGLCWQLREKSAQLGCCLKLRDRIELLEGAGKGVGQAPHGPGREFRILRLEMEPVDLGQQAPGAFQPAVDERGVED